MKTKHGIFLSVKVLLLLGVCFYGVSCFTPYPPNYITIHKFKDSTYYNYVMASSNKRFCFPSDEADLVAKFVDNSYIVHLSQPVSMCELATHEKYIKLHQGYFICYPYKLDDGANINNVTLWNLPWEDVCDSAKFAAAAVLDSVPIAESCHIYTIKIKGYPDNITASQLEDYVNGIIDRGELEKYGAQYSISYSYGKSRQTKSEKS